MSSPSLTGYSAKNALRYLGPNVTIETIVTRNREPTVADYRQPETGKYYPFGCLWLVGKDPTTGTWGDLWYLSYINGNVAYWNRFTESFVTDLWTPNLQIDGSDTDIIYDSHLGGYTQSANVVTIWLTLTLTSKGSSNGVVTISNLPVAPLSNGTNQFIPINTFNGFTAAGYTSLSLRLSNNSTVGQIIMSGSGAGVTGISDANISNNFLIAFTGSYIID
jgi:hypothetical protein